MAKTVETVSTNPTNDNVNVPVKPAIIEPNKVGLVNRKDCNVVVTFTDGNSIVLAPKQRTGKEYLKESIKSVNGRSLANAGNDVMVLN